MANNIGWGQGAVNNLIGWGQGAISNLIGWGSIYILSWSGETDIIGSPVPSLVSAFNTRVIANSGTIEAEACLTTTLTNLNNI